MAYERTHRPTVQSMLGKFKVPQASYRCGVCVEATRRSRPRRAELGLAGSGKITRCAERAIGLLAAESSFARAAKTFSVVTGLHDVNAKQVERIAKRLGEQVATASMAVTPPPPVDIMHMEIDGTGVPMRPEATAGRAGKAADGSASTREVKVMATWESAADAPSYDAGVEPVTGAAGEPSFAERYRRHAQRTGFDAAQRQVLISDGAPWIECLTLAHHPDTTCILDFFHVAEHLYDACIDHYGQEGPARRKFESLKGKLRNGQLMAVVNCLRQFSATQTVNYLLRNEARLDYPRFKAAGLPKSSARVESACKNVIGARFKRGGMRWSLDGLKPMLALRCEVCNDGLDAYYETLRKAQPQVSAMLGPPLAMAA